MKLTNEQLIQIFYAYPFAKVKMHLGNPYNNKYGIFSLWEVLKYYDNDVSQLYDCTLQLRSLESIKESEAKEFNKITGGKYSIKDLIWAGKEDRLNKDWRRKHNFFTEVSGIDLIEAGIAEINNEIY